MQSSTPEPVVAGTNRSADRAYLATLEDRTAAILDSVFSADARRTVHVSESVSRVVSDPARPANASLLRSDEDRSVRVERGNATLLAAPAGFESVGTRERRVVVTETTTRRWRVGDRTETARERRETVYRVGVRVAVRYGHTERAPQRGFENPDESVYAGVPDRARERLLSDVSGVARRAVRDGTTAAEAAATLTVERPEGVRDRVVSNVTALHRRARNVSVRLPPSAVVDGNPAASLATRFDRFSERASAAPQKYPDAERKATVAVRRAYLDAVAQRLRLRSENAANVDAGVADALGGKLPLGETPVSSLLTPEPLPANRSNLTVRARPAYLSLSKSERTGSYPLAARNTNVFAVPYGDAADTLTETVLGGGKRKYGTGTAARALAAANGTLADRSNESLAAHRTTLRTELAAATATTRRTLVGRLDDAGVSPGTAERAVRAGLARWDTVHGRALALANGSAAGPIADAAAERTDAVARAELAAEVRLVLAERRTVSLPEAAVTDTVGGTRSAATQLARDALGSGLDRLRDRAAQRLPEDVRASLSKVPNGLPVAPVPGYWYATVNVWDVEIEGGYRHLSVRAPTGNALNGTLTYTREDAPVNLDTDGDGTPELVGRNRAPTFDVRTGVAVVVPPGSRGVGDAMNADERSAGWGAA